MMFAELRQWLYPKEFRIKGSGFSSKHFQMDEVIKKVEDLIKQILDMPTDQIDTKFIKEMATSVWRLEKRMEKLPDDSSSIRVKRALNMIKDVLKDHKIEIKDYTGKPWEPPYDEMPWDDAKGKGDIIRMVEPCILWDGKFLQRGKIIVEERR